MTMLQERAASGQFAGAKKTKLMVELITEHEVPAATIEKLVEVFLENEPAWAAAHRTSPWSLRVRERGREVTWDIDSHRIGVALGRLASASSSTQKLRGFQPSDPAIEQARLLLMNPELTNYMFPRTAEMVIQVAVFGELEYA